MRWRQVQQEELSLLQQLSRRSSDEAIQLLADGLRAARRDLSRLANQRLPDSGEWIERQPVHRLQTARDLVRQFPASTNAKGFLALDGIDYGPPLAPHADDAPPPAAAQRNLAGQLEKGFKPLTASGQEAEQVAVFFRRCFIDARNAGN